MLLPTEDGHPGPESLVKPRPRRKYTSPDSKVGALPDAAEVRAFEPLGCTPFKRQPFGAAEDDSPLIFVTQRIGVAVERRKRHDATSDRSDAGIEKLCEQCGQPRRLR